jgi:uracil-DNA glycosylase family 4
MEGFFAKEDMEDKDAPCVKCKLHKTCNTPRIKVGGKGGKKILIIGEMPSATEDEEGVMGRGSATEILKLALKENGISLKKDCWKTNAVSCRTPKGKAPSKQQIKLCHSRLESVIKKKKPNLIILLGNVALDSFINTRLSEASGGINRWRGFIVPDQRYKTWMMSTYHPSHIMKSRDEKILLNLFKRDLEAGLKKLKKKVPVYKHKIEILSNDRANNMLQQYLDSPPDLLSFDYETTGLKPYKKGHEIVCVAVCCSDTAFAFTLEDKKVLKYWKQVLKDKGIKKTAQNLKFEQLWSKIILGTTVKGWKWDTMQASHILDNRKYIVGLKFQSYINFGQEDYSSHLDKYIKTKDDEEFNKIREAGINQVMQYCAMDAILEHKLALKQMKELE